MVEHAFAEPVEETARDRRLAVLAAGTWVYLAFAAVVVAIGLLVASTLPYGEYDAMAFGTWSRLIAEHFPDFHFAAAAGPADYHRPLFYVLQAVVWKLFGFHQALGRLLSLAFSLVLVGSVAIVARAGVPRQYARLAAALAAVIAFSSSVLARHLASGLSDVPAAAMIAATGAVLVSRRRLGRAYLPLLAVAALLAALAKPSAYAALAGFVLAVLLGPRQSIRRRLPTVVALGAGLAVGLAYDESQARYLHMTLSAFLRAGTDGLYAQEATAARRDTLLESAWLGAELRLLLVFAILYALARVARAAHRQAVVAAAGLGVVWCWLGPHLAGRPGIFAAGNDWTQVATLVLAATLLLAVAAPEATIPRRLELARLLLAAAVPFAFWARYAVYDTRLAAPMWPALLVLAVRAFLPVVAGALRRTPLLAVAPLAALLLVALVNTENINGFGASGWRQYWSNGLSGIANAADMRNVAYGGDFDAEIDAVLPQVGPHDRIATWDGRLRFFYLDRVDFGPSSCGAVRNDRAVLALEDDEIHATIGKLATSQYWASCAAPHLTKVAERPGAFALFVNGTPSTAGAGSCGAPAATPGLAIEFGRFASAAAANAALKHVVSLGFVQAKVEQLGCASYRVAETGVPDRKTGASIVQEARSAHLRATVVTTPG